MTAKEIQNAVMVLRGHKSLVYSADITSDGKRALSGSGDSTLKLWDLASGKSTATFKSHKSTANVLGRRWVKGHVKIRPFLSNERSGIK